MPCARALADAVLVIEPDVEPHRRVERAVLVHAEPGQLVVESLGRFRVCEIAVLDAPVGDRAGDAVDELAHRSFASALVRIGAVGDVAVEILRDGDLRGELAPALRHLDVFLLEDHLAAVVGDFRGAAFPFDLVEWRDGRIAEHPLETQTAIFLSFHRFFCRAADCGGLLSEAG